METTIIKIGNSQGVRIPKPMLKQCGLSGRVEMTVKENELVIRPHQRKIRENWDEAYQKMAFEKDERIVDDLSESGTKWDTEEWEW
ncbi:MAG: AbrB/MazE/SpoVT family DNA-binding domain-containing protein [Deltaproteobacteria bacterium]|nr:AbrB/MazE/SpoVT family DNA-binding domain-containing protein [Deltaproteobacteria bacterium]MBN2671966.1 AbrB/MazE/SpoVT family DNA-binding domain-containing protein [Deltaproteobacteria bacterium]